MLESQSRGPLTQHDAFQTMPIVSKYLSILPFGITMINEFPPEFILTPVQVADRMMIRSACAKCGESRLVSMYDRSLEKWERRHRCKSESLKPAKRWLRIHAMDSR